jgi:hypothetical protein
LLLESSTARLSEITATALSPAISSSVMNRPWATATPPSSASNEP